ncbi:MAG TPA: FAD-binding oxidoreductase [Nocardioidaceae bacterium]|nr:FAD-binding oxidoreductase [Nocardioidaceae bacterium]
MTDLFERPTAMAGFKGQVLMTGDPGYDEARRVFNGMFDRRPERIMRCSDTFDVIAAVNTARQLGLPLSVYGGGHGVTGSAVVDGGICIDLRRLDQISVDPEARTVKVAAGATWGAVDAATQEHGLAVTGGRVSSTGVGGLALGSGSGWLERKLGFTCDNLVSAKVVTAAGKLVLADKRVNPDLFWGLRGGGGNFGIVTEFTFSLHEVGPIVLGGMLMYPAWAARDLVRFWRDFMTTAPDEVGSAVAFITAPPIDAVPEPVRGQPVVGVIVCYAGPVEEGREVLAPLLEFGPPAVNLVQPMPYVAVQQLIDDGNPKGMRNYWNADFLADLPDEAIDTLVAHGTRPVSPLSQVILVAGGGALARVPEEATAFGQRTAPWNLHMLSMWPDPAADEANIAHTRAMSAAMRPWATGRVYLNFIGDEGPGRVEAAYGPEKYSQLQQLKQVWDPDNVFCHNQNVAPRGIPVQPGP